MNSEKNPSPRSMSGTAQLRRRFLPAWALMAVAASVLGGCQLLPPPSQDSTRFFVLTGPALAAVAEGVSPAANGVQLGLRPITLPSYLRATKSMVVRDGANEIRYQDYSRWAESLEAGVGRVLAEKLSSLPGVRGVDAHPMRGAVLRDYDILVRVTHCEGATGESPVARFAAAYEIIATEDNRVVVTGSFVAPEAAWDGKDFSALARLLSDAVSALAEKIAADLPKN